MVDIKSIDILQQEVGSLIHRIHPLAENMPLMDDGDFKALVQSIDDIGQVDPIYVYRGLVVDGRNRLNALVKLKHSIVLVQNLPHKTTKEELSLIVNAKEARRKQSKLQLAISGYNIWNTTGERQDVVAKRLGIGDTSIRKIKDMIEKLGMSQDVLKSLHDGNSFVIDSTRGISTNKLESIYTYYVRNSKAKVISESLGSINGLSDEENKMINIVMMMVKGSSRNALLQLNNNIIDIVSSLK